MRSGGTDPLLTRLPLFGTKIRVAGFGGLRLGEQNALRAIDVFFDRGFVQVNGSWVTPRHSEGFRGPVKNHVIHEVPLPRSVMDELLPDPRHVFLDAHDVMARYGWGTTKGYQNLNDRSLVPEPVMTHPNRWRLDQLLAWEGKRMEVAEAALERLLAPEREEVTVADLLPQPKRRRRAG